MLNNKTAKKRRPSTLYSPTVPLRRHASYILYVQDYYPCLSSVPDSVCLQSCGFCCNLSFLQTSLCPFQTWQNFPFAFPLQILTNACPRSVFLIVSACAVMFLSLRFVSTSPGTFEKSSFCGTGSVYRNN